MWLKGSPTPGLTRIKIAELSGDKIAYPDISGLELVIDHLSAMRWAKQGFNGLEALRPVDINEYLIMTGTDMQTWLKEMIIELSNDYVNQAAISNDPNCLEPAENSERGLEMSQKAAEQALMDSF